MFNNSARLSPKKTMPWLIHLALLAGGMSILTACQTIDPEMYAAAQNIKTFTFDQAETTNRHVYTETPIGELDEYLVRLKTRPLVFQNILITKPAAPKAVVILFEGGKGLLEFTVDDATLTMSDYLSNFLVRTRRDFANKELIAVVADAPSDMYLGLWDMRTTQDHLADISVVVKYLRGQFKLPVWLVGTSRGTESAAFYAINGESKIEGLVLTSTVSDSDKLGKGVSDMRVASLSVPVLLVHHEQDNCIATSFQSAQKLHSKLKEVGKSIPRLELKSFAGGRKPISPPCEALSLHGFYGIEKEVARHIAGFIERSR